MALNTKNMQRAQKSFKGFTTPNKDKPSRFSRVRSYVQNNSNGLKGVLGLILLFLVIISLYRLSVGQSIPLFTDLLETITSSPSLQIPTLSSGVNITVENLGVFGFLSPILNILVTAVDLIVFIVNGLINLITFAFHFLNWIFVRG